MLVALSHSTGEEKARLLAKRLGHQLGIPYAAPSLLKQETTCKTGIAIKPQNAGWDDDYRENVLIGAAV